MTVFAYDPNKFAPTVKVVQEPNKAGEVVDIISRKHRIAFVVSPHREDQRHGSTSPRTPMSDYWRSMFTAVSIK